MKIRGQALAAWLLAWERRQQGAEESGQWRLVSLLLCGMALLLGLQNPLLYGMTPAFDASLFAAREFDVDALSEQRRDER